MKSYEFWLLLLVNIFPDAAVERGLLKRDLLTIPLPAVAKTGRSVCTALRCNAASHWVVSTNAVSCTDFVKTKYLKKRGGGIELSQNMFRRTERADKILKPRIKNLF